MDSTNAEALRRAAAGDAGNLWIWADTQSQGRGRSGRSWDSAKQNLFASLLLRPTCSLDTALQLSLVSAVAVHDTVRALASDVIAETAMVLKWPNDLLIDDQKVAGILLESVGPGTEGESAVVIGVGINLASAPQGATHLDALGVAPAPSLGLQQLASQMSTWLRIWSEGQGFDVIRQAWHDRALEAGRPISVKLPEGIVSGKYGGIDEMGALRLLGETGETRITTGDVFLS